MITKIFFRRTTTDNKPQIVLVNAAGAPQYFEISEAEYDHWVPDTNHLHGEDIRHGIDWEKEPIPNLKAT